jgi:uncharacterized protein (DUF39 family)
MAPRTAASDPWSQRSFAALQQRQQQGTLQVRTAAAYRALVAQVGLRQAFEQTDVVAAADAVLTDQGALLLSLGPADPPIRWRELQLGGVQTMVGGTSDLVLPLGGGLADPNRRSGAQVLSELLAGQTLNLSGLGEVTPLQPRSELSGQVGLAHFGAARLLLQRVIVENGVVAVSSAEGLLRTPYGAVLGPLVSALYSCGGPGSIGLTMPGLSQLGPGSPVLVGGAIGTVVGAGSGHYPAVRRLASGHACGPGLTAAVVVELEQLCSAGLHSCFLEGHGAALLVPIAAPVALLDAETAAQAAAGPEQLEAPVLDLAIPRRIKPRLASVSYAALDSGRFNLGGRAVRCAPAHSPRLAAAAAAQLVELLRSGALPLREPLQPLSGRNGLVPLDL